MEAVSFTRFFFALLLVLALIGITAAILKRFGGRQWRGLAGPRRMAMVESLVIDPRYRLVIVTTDGKERLLLLGPQSAKELECKKISHGRKRLSSMLAETAEMDGA